MKKWAVWVLRLLIFVFGFLGVYLEVSSRGLFMFTYYTILSNVLVVCFTGVLLYKMYQDYDYAMTSTTLLRLKGAVTIAILLTFLVYHFMLAPLATPEKYYRLDNFLVHYIVPIAFFLDWILFDKRGVYEKLDALYWCVIPFVYSIFALIKGYVFQIEIPGQVNSPYPYFFLNVDKFGFSGVFAYMFGILAFYLVLGFLLYIIKMYKAAKKCG